MAINVAATEFNELANLGPTSSEDESLSAGQARQGYNSEATVDHDLRWYHIIAITISGVLGAGLYVRSGAMIEVGGPAAVFFPYLCLGALAWAIMQTIGEMICIWPISNALVLLVRTFVDDDLGTVVGIIYWFTYTIGFSCLLTAAASEAAIWTCKSDATQALGFLFGPLIGWFVLNCLGVKAYGFSELVGGSIKVLFVAIVFVTMILINTGVGSQAEYVGSEHLDDFFAFNPDEVQNWGVAFFIALQVGSFSFVGIEIPAVTALEAKMTAPPDAPSNAPSDATRAPKRPANSALQFACAWLPFLVVLIYEAMGMIASSNVDRGHPDLPSQNRDPARSTYPTSCRKTSSVFVISAVDSKIAGLDDAITAFTIVTAWTSANTALYVSSRTLYGLFVHLKDSSPPQNRNALYVLGWKLLRLMGTTRQTHRGKRIPLPALFFSTFVFCFLPFLQLVKGTSSAETLFVLTEMGSVFCIIVWACQCLAYIRLHNALYKWRDEINNDVDLQFLRRWRPSNDHATNTPQDPNEWPYPWKSVGQPYTAWFGFCGCLVIVVVAGGSPLWNGWNKDGAVSFVAAYLPLLLFAALLFGLKMKHRRRSGPGSLWSPVDLSTSYNNHFKHAVAGINANRANRMLHG